VRFSYALCYEQAEARFLQGLCGELAKEARDYVRVYSSVGVLHRKQHNLAGLLDRCCDGDGAFFSELYRVDYQV
jgi:hypothetical protein